MPLCYRYLGALLFDGHPGRPEHPATLEKAGYGGRLEAYPTDYLQDLSRPERAIAATIMEAES
ncbi:MAG: hypothetical protein ACFB0G_01895 [Leptolyngbyaceae cyanobacterium]